MPSSSDPFAVGTDFRTLRPFFWASGLFFSLAFSGMTAAQSPEPIAIGDLPRPSDEIVELLQAGQVKFVHGPRPAASDASGKDDPSSAESERGDFASRLAAETTYRLAYSYRSRNRWTVSRVNGRRQLVVTAQFSSAELSPKHVVWLRRRPSDESFWADRLVLHELDHVRISSDSRLESRFSQLLAARNVIETEWPSRDRVTDAIVKRLVDRRVKEVFDEINDLVAIRYRELDRVTRHGVDPLPAGSPLSDWLARQPGRR